MGSFRILRRGERSLFEMGDVGLKIDRFAILESLVLARLFVDDVVSGRGDSGC